MEKQKLYTFVDDRGNIIIQVMAWSHDDAVQKAGNKVNFQTDFYSEKL